MSRGNTALAHASEVEAELIRLPADNVVPMSQRLSLLELDRGLPATDRGRSFRQQRFFSAAARR